MPRHSRQIAALLSPGQALITGAARMEDPLPGEIVGRFFNAIQVVSHDGTVTGSYDKVHLVPFGEYLPSPVEALVRAIGLRQFVTMPGGFVPADSRRALSVGGLPPVAATICYEAIFPGEITGEGPRPDLILNVTNDAWFGETPGPYQHFAQARLRAVEEGLPLVRAANTGISAVVDPYGRVVDALASAAGRCRGHIPWLRPSSTRPVESHRPIYRGLWQYHFGLMSARSLPCLSGGFIPLLGGQDGGFAIRDSLHPVLSPVLFPRRITVQLKKSTTRLTRNDRQPVRMRRMLIGMSQEKLGEMLGLTFQQVQKYEKGTNRSAPAASRIAKVLGVNIQYFYEVARGGARTSRAALPTTARPPIRGLHADVPKGCSSCAPSSKSRTPSCAGDRSSSSEPRPARRTRRSERFFT